MKAGTVIFHHPGPVEPGGRSGSQLRPWRMLEAFRELEYEVESVTGYAAERRLKIRQLLPEIKKGRRFDFVYSESRSIPTLLTEKRRVPLHPFLEFRFLQILRNSGVPVGLFYRDVFWRFDLYRDKLPWFGRAVTVPLYYYDWWWYQRMVDHLFLPSVGMVRHLPSAWPLEHLSALPPGAHLPQETLGSGSTTDSVSRALRLLYVGGIQPPTYDLTPLLKSVNQVSGVHLTLCCRVEEWRQMSGYYSPLMNGRVNIVHIVGHELAQLYAHADIFALVWKPNAYLDFAVPVKIFESVGYGVPILTLAGTEAARVVEQQALGWVGTDEVEIEAILRQLQGNRKLIKEKCKQVLTARQRHSWQARVQEIRNQLSRYR